MTQTNDLQAVADEILDNAIAAAPFNKRIDELKEVMASATTTAGEGLAFASAKGMVKTSKGSVAKLTGRVGTVDMDVWNALPEKKKTELLKLNLVSFKDVYSQNRKPAVTITPILPRPAQNDNAKPAEQETAAA